MSGKRPVVNRMSNEQIFKLATALTQRHAAISVGGKKKWGDKVDAAKELRKELDFEVTQHNVKHACQVAGINPEELFSSHNAAGGGVIARFREDLDKVLSECEALKAQVHALQDAQKALEDLVCKQ